MKHIFTILTFFIVFNCFGQLSHSPDPAVINTHVDTLQEKYAIDITVEADTSYTVHWQLFLNGETWVDTWGVQVCDINLCYLENVLRNSQSIPNHMGKSTHHWYVYVSPNETPGDSDMELVLYGDAEQTIEIHRIPIEVHVAGRTNTFNVALNNEVNVFPNPAQEYFSLSNDSNVETIRLYNVLGSEIKAFNHYDSAKHSISDLNPGMYLLSMFDKQNNILKTSRFNISYSKF